MPYIGVAASPLQDEGGKLQTVVPVMSLADFPDPAAAAQHVKAVMLGYPHTNAVILREAGILCWGLMTHAQVKACTNINLWPSTPLKCAGLLALRSEQAHPRNRSPDTISVHMYRKNNHLWM